MNLFKMASKTKLNVQSFPRPPSLEKTPRHLQIKWNGELMADTKDAYWVLETHHPPSMYSCRESTRTHIVQTVVLLLTSHSVLPPTVLAQSPTHQNSPQDLVRMERRSNVLVASQPDQPLGDRGKPHLVI